MIRLKFLEDCTPRYMTAASAACDLIARETVVVKAGEVAKIPTGVWISHVEWEKVPANHIPELQVRARSGLAFKHGLTLANGVGTIDADYPDEIAVLLLNTSRQDFTVEKGMRTAQLLQSLVMRIDDIPVGGERTGGFGSTKV
ncbi:MAG: dUTP diphosphatase [Oligoflexus sp.]